MTTIALDARSVNAGRLTGWERYARQLVSLAVEDPRVELIAPNINRVSRRLLSDWTSVPYRSRGRDIRHYVSFPPPAPRPATGTTIQTICDLTWWTHPEKSSFLGRHYYRRLAERALADSLVVTISNTVASEIQEFFGIRDVNIVCPYVSLRDHAAQPMNGFEKPFFLTIGSVEPRKNLTRLVEAYRASGISREFELVVVGREAWGTIDHGIRRISSISDGQLRFLMESSSGVFCPSIYEGFGLPSVEALSLGTRIYCSDIPVYRETLGEHAIYYDPTSIDQIADCFRLASGADGPGLRDAVLTYTRHATMKQLNQLYADAEER